MIEFLCPEGHKIRCAEEKAGRPAKCPKCGVGFRIPTIEELGLGESAIADNSLSSEEVADVAAGPASPGSGSRRRPAEAAAPSKEQQIEFLCPNGHHLHGPSSLQGRAGECPECGSRFHIPIIDAPQAEAAAAAPELEFPAGDEITLEISTTPDGAVHVQPAEPLDFVQLLDGGSGAAGVPAQVPIGGGGPIINLTAGPDGVVMTGHPLAALFIELWAARGEGSRVEVHLESGSVLAPDGYVKPHSQQDYAVFVTRDPDGCSTITVVPWSSIARIILRAIKEVPGEVVR